MSPPKATTARVQALLALAVDADDALPLLDLKDLALDRMLEELSLVSLAAMACVCAGIRERCFMVSLWARPVRRKWGRVLGVAACKEWEAELGDRDSAAAHPRPTRRGSCVDSLACAWSFTWIECRCIKEGTAALPPIRQLRRRPTR